MTRGPMSPSWLTRLRYPHLGRAHRLWKHCKGVVQSGPFAGMTITAQTTGALLPPYLLGSFEADLHETIASFDASPPQGVVNVGAGDGYYAVGFAYLWPNCQITAFDPLQSAQTNTAAWANASKVSDRISLQGAATPENLESHLASFAPGSCLIWCDCEGAEELLANPDRVPSWSTCSFVIELHPWVIPDIEETLTTRFASSHSLSVIEDSPHSTSAFPPPAGWPSRPNEDLLNEGREHPGRWLIGRPNQGKSQ